ncbi:MAG: hypothetical protein ACM3JJ_12655 [Hyphomicrobiales bacterium]
MAATLAAALVAVFSVVSPLRGEPLSTPAPESTAGVLAGSIHGDLAAAGLAGARTCSVAWRDFDGDGDQDFLLLGTDGEGFTSRIYRNEGDGFFRAVASCVTSSDTTICDGDQSAGIKIAATTSLHLWVRDLTTDVTPAAGVRGIEATVTGGGGQAGPVLEIHFVGGGHAIVTQGDGAHGIYGSTQGGNGGNGSNDYGGFNPFYPVSYGGNGAAGGAGGALTIVANGPITTSGDGSHGIFAVSQGGNGGRGGHAGAIAYAEGGDGGAGGKGGDVTVANHGAIATEGDGSHGIVAESRGGNGGNGGDAGATVAVGGNGGGGGRGGVVSIVNDGAISTEGEESHGIVGRSLGGVGGNGGVGGGLVGGGGGASPSGAGGDVTIDNAGAVTTTGAGSNGLFVQSIGGFGAGGGASGGLVSFGGIGATGGNGGEGSIANTGTVTTSGDDANALFVQSVGGGGGSGAGSGGLVSLGGSGSAGGNGGDVTIDNAGVLTTHGSFANAIFAQSIGGGGGNGGGSGGLVSIGGGGSATGNGGDVLVRNSGTIATEGDFANAILAQSVGGGGGNGGGSGGLFSFGGSGAAGGDGDSVTVSHDGSIHTSGADAAGILAQSIGGGGGNGGGSGSVGAYVSVAVGGAAGPGGDGSRVVVTGSDGAIETDGDRSHGIHAQSIGGGGGNGGFAFSVAVGDKFSASVAVGGKGGDGGKGGVVDVSSALDVTTHGDDAHGILAESIGGGGGSGGFALALSASTGPSASLAIGGSGGKGGNADSVRVANAGRLETSGFSSYGILAQSVGGGGGSGGNTFAGSASGKLSISASFGGKGGDGGAGGVVTVLNGGSIGTHGDEAHAIFAQSVGGGGGAGGFSSHVSGSVENGFSFGLGGSGGKGGAGGSVLVANAGAMATDGFHSYGVLAQSVGGGGGSGGATYTIGGLSQKNSLSLSIGGSGGLGGHGAGVRVENAGSIATSGAESHGIFAQSVGGGGGDGGNNMSITLPKLGGGSTPSLSGDARGAHVAAESPGAVAAGADSMTLDLSIGIGGKGGAAGNGGKVAVVNSGDIRTTGTLSNGIVAQSVGGGGGGGGTNVDVSLPSLGSGEKSESLDLSLNVTIGGSGGAAGSGDSVRVDNAGNIQTDGDLSHGIFAQSVGGGGGSEIVDVDSPLGDASSVLGFSGLGITIGGAGGAAGNGGAVTVTNGGDIATHGLTSHGIFAQSVGGGGGQGGEANAGLVSVFSLGGKGGAAGDGGAVRIGNSGTILTTGDGSYGILAQSVGGGGGVGGDVTRGLGDLDVGIGPAIGGDGTNGGNGGTVVVENAGDIVTQGSGSIGIFAQSVGGGGGLGGGAGNWDSAILLSFAGSVGGGGSGGAVTVTQSGSIQTAGDGAHGIFAQSAGGKGQGGTVDVTVDGDVLASGADANGIFVQSIGQAGNGDITVAVESGTVQGGSGESAGVLFLDGKENTLTNHGTVTSLGGVDGMAVRGTGGDETIDNFGIITGTIDLGGGTNQVTNHEGGVINAGATLDLGPDGTLINSGTFSPGGAGAVGTTTLGCDFVQTDAGTFELTVCGSSMDQLIVTGGSVTLDGTLKVVADHEAYQDGTTYDVVQAVDGDVTGTFSEIDLPESAFLTFDVTNVGSTLRVKVDVASFCSCAGNPVEHAVGGYLDSCLPTASGDMAHLIGMFQIASADQVAQAFASLSPDTYDNLTRGELQSVRLHEDALAERMNTARSSAWIESESPSSMSFGQGNGWWVSGTRQGADQDAGSGYLAHNYTITGGLGGYERASETALLGASIGTMHADVDRDNDMASGTTKSILASAYAGRLWGRAFVQGIATYANNSFENRRDVRVNALERVAVSDHDGHSFSGLLTAGRRFDAGRWALEPFATARYLHLSEKGFTETGAGSANLIVEPRSTDWLGSDLGVRLSTRFVGDRSAFLPELLLGWSHDYGLDDRAIVASFEGDPSMTFTLAGQDVKRDGALLGAGLTYYTTGGWKASVRYDRGQRGDYRSNGFSLRLGSSF